jgi:hypothetical protein
MPYPMPHLYTAWRVAENSPLAIENFPQFYLGSIAPDGVHFRENYNSGLKLLSHLCVGDEKWGMLTNNDNKSTNPPRKYSKLILKLT